MAPEANAFPPPTNAAQAKTRAAQAVEDHLADLTALSHRIHANPETCFEETKAARWTAETLAAAGFTVTTGAYDLPTAFVASSGDGPFTVAICAEYDALPEVGHACGHNIIAASAVGAGLGLATVADELGASVRVIGTPAEEGGGGKILLLQQGAFDGVHAAMMVHPWPDERLQVQCLAVAHVDVTYTGKEAHASAAAWKGVNAGDAMTVAQVALSALRQQLPPGDQIHGIVTSWGSAANIIPGRVTGRFMFRSKTIDGLEALTPRVRNCFEAGALATGCELDITEISPIYSHMEQDADLLASYRSNAENLGRHFELDDDNVAPPTLSTDMSNVSLAVPTIHPLIGIEASGAVNHQPAFAAACITSSADAALHDGAVAMAWTAIDAATDADLRERLLAGTPSRGS